MTDATTAPIPRCSNCGEALARIENGVLKFLVRSKILAVRDDGQAEMNCPGCRSKTGLPLVYARDA